MENNKKPNQQAIVSIVDMDASNPSMIFRRFQKFQSSTQVMYKLRINSPFGCGGGGRGLEAIGTHPMAAARAKGSQAATDAIIHWVLKLFH